MTTSTPFSVLPEDLERLTARGAVDLIRKLLYAEAEHIGLARPNINVPSAITTSDGGIDADIKESPRESGQGIIKKGLSCYQIKTGKYELSQKNKQLDILCKPYKKGSNRELNDRVKSCFDRNGTFIIVIFGWDGPDDVVDNLKKIVSDDFGYTNASIEVWRPNQIANFFEPYPALQLEVIGIQSAGFKTHNQWSKEQEMSRPWHPDTRQQDLVNDLTQALRTQAKPLHIHLMGEPGVGKTRAALEATVEPDLSSQVLYFTSGAHTLKETNTIHDLLRRDLNGNLLLVVDECSTDEMRELWNWLGYTGSKIRLVTINSDLTRMSGTTVFLQQKPLEDKQISEIIAGYGFMSGEVNRWVPYCSGSPRVAHVLGQNLRQNPDDLLRSPDTVPIWERYIAGQYKPDSADYQRNLKILSWLSLFKRFGYGKPYSKEAELISRKIQALEGISYGDFCKSVQELRDRKILQGETTLYITPRLLHIWLWTGWWNIHGSVGKFDLAEFKKSDPGNPSSEEFPNQLMDWFFEMFKYAQGSGASKIVEWLLSPEGPFNAEFLETIQGSSFFRYLAEADPRAAIGCLKRVLGRLPVDQLQAMTISRRSAVNALEMAAMWNDLFIDSADLLLKLAEAENETWANNATGVFTGLFSLSIGEGAPTEAPPQTRFTILDRAFKSGNPAVRRLALKACASALSTHGGVRLIGAEYQGLRPAPKLWKPPIWGEVFDAYRAAWNMVVEQLDMLPSDEQQEASKILLDSARGLTGIANLAGMVVDTLTDLVNSPKINQRDLIDTATSILFYDGKNISPEVNEKWKNLRDLLVKDDYHSRLRRYAGVALLEDEFDENHNHVDQAKPKLQVLADESLENPELLNEELPWLMSTSAERGFQFGFELGSRSKDHKLLPTLINTQHKQGVESVFFLSGYLRAIREQSEEAWEMTLDHLAKDDVLCYGVAEMTWRSGSVTDRAADRIIALAKSGKMEAYKFRMFIYGSSLNILSVSKFLEFTQYMQEIKEDHSLLVSIALNLFDTYFIRNGESKVLPQKETNLLLTDSILFEDAPESGYDTTTRFHWKEVVQHYLEKYPADGIQIAIKALSNFDNDRSVCGGYFSEAKQIVRKIAHMNPVEIWNEVTKLLGPPIDGTAYDIAQWLHGEAFSEGSGDGALSEFPLELIWQWVEENVDERAWYVANFCPKIFHQDKDRPCIAREILIRYGARDDVRQELMANFWSGGWSGPASLHFQQQKNTMLSYLQSETDPHVRHWLEDFITQLDSTISYEKAREERQF